MELNKTINVRVPKVVIKVLIAVMFLGAGYVGIMEASKALNNFLFGIYGVGF